MGTGAAGAPWGGRRSAGCEGKAPRLRLGGLVSAGGVAVGWRLGALVGGGAASPADGRGHSTVVLPGGGGAPPGRAERPCGCGRRQRRVAADVRGRGLSSFLGRADPPDERGLGRRGAVQATGGSGAGLRPLSPRGLRGGSGCVKSPRLRAFAS